MLSRHSLSHSKHYVNLYGFLKRRIHALVGKLYKYGENVFSEYLAYEILHSDSWQGFCTFIFFHSPDSRLFCTFYSMVYIFIFDGVTVKTENICRTTAELKHAGIALKRSKMLGTITTKNKTRRQGIEEVVVYIYCYFYAVNNYR